MTYTAWKVSKYGVFSGPYFPVFGLDTEIYVVNRIQSECWKIRTRKNSSSGHFSRSDTIHYHLYLFNMDQKVKGTFSSQPMESFCSARKSSSYFIQAKLYPLERRVVSHKCRCNCCEVCCSITETDMFIYNTDQRSY